MRKLRFRFALALLGIAVRLAPLVTMEWAYQVTVRQQAMRAEMERQVRTLLGVGERLN